MKTIGISTLRKSPGLRRMLHALGEVFGVRIEDQTFGGAAGVDAWIFPEGDPDAVPEIARSDKPCYVVLRDDLLVACGESSSIEFSRHAALPRVLTGRRVESEEAVTIRALPRQFRTMSVLAGKDGAPVWATQKTNEQRHHYVSLPVPELQEGEQLFQYFHGNRFLQLLPLLVFLRTLGEDRRWTPPSLRACFMFDDPNLHWRTYGFIDFAQMAAHARVHRYHVSFATIPQDAWFFYKPAATLFQQNRDYLSLLMHGNDHTSHELARPQSEKDRHGNLRQALERIDAFERRSGVNVARAMVPPHGACYESTLREMASLEFEIACISQGSLRRYNAKAPWLRTLAMKPSDIIAGLPVVPRLPLSGHCHNSILVAALLHQPILVRGHHKDIAKGLQLLAEVSAYVNSFESVHWADMKRISRSHYAQRQDGNVLHARMFTKHIEVSIPEGIARVLVDRPWLQTGEIVPVSWRAMSRGAAWKTQSPDAPIPVLPGQKVAILSGASRAASPDAQNIRRLRLWSVMRRQFTEARDRLAPWLT